MFIEILEPALSWVRSDQFKSKILFQKIKSLKIQTHKIHHSFLFISKLLCKIFITTLTKLLLLFQLLHFKKF